MLFLSSPREAAALTKASCLALQPAGVWVEAAVEVVVVVAGFVEGIAVVLFGD